MYKSWGDANESWFGEEGVVDGPPIRILETNVSTSTLSLRPKELPLEKIITSKLIRDVRELSYKHNFLGVEETQQMELFLSSGGDLTKLIHITGANDEGG